MDDTFNRIAGICCVVVPVLVYGTFMACVFDETRARRPTQTELHLELIVSCLSICIPSLIALAMSWLPTIPALCSAGVAIFFLLAIRRTQSEIEAFVIVLFHVCLVLLLVNVIREVGEAQQRPKPTNPTAQPALFIAKPSSWDDPSSHAPYTRK